MVVYPRASDSLLYDLYPIAPLAYGVSNPAISHGGSSPDGVDETQRILRWRPFVTTLIIVGVLPKFGSAQEKLIRML